MREGTRVDADGYHVFTLDETKHDEFAVLERLWKAAGHVPMTVDPKFEAMRAMKPEQLSRFDAAYADRLDREKAARR